MRSFAAFALVVALAAAYAAKHPEYNWDMIPYTAAVVSFDTHDPAAIHAETYRLVRAEVPPARMAELVGDPYKRGVADSPTALMQQLPFYRIRPAYILALRGLTLLGINAARATVLLSVFGYVALCMLIWLWLRETGAPEWLRLACALLLAVSQPLLHMAALDNSDAMSTVCVVFAFYLFVARHKPYAALGVFLASVLVRSDNMFLCVLFAGLLLWRQRQASARRWLLPAAAALAAFSWVVLWHHAVGNYGWRLTMYHSFIAPLTLPAEGVPAMSTAQLAKMWVGGLASLRYSSLSLALLLCACAWALRPREASRRDGRDAVLVLLAALLVHVAIFPNLEDRFFVAHYVVIALVGAGWLLAEAQARATQSADEPEARVYVATSRSRSVVGE